MCPRRFRLGEVWTELRVRTVAPASPTADGTQGCASLLPAQTPANAAAGAAAVVASARARAGLDAHAACHSPARGDFFLEGAKAGADVDAPLDGSLKGLRVHVVLPCELRSSPSSPEALPNTVAEARRRLTRLTPEVQRVLFRRKGPARASRIAGRRNTRLPSS